MNNNKSSASRTINNKLVIARLNKNLTQKQVAERALIDRAYYTKIENGQCKAAVETYKDIAIALGYRRWKDLIPDNIEEVCNGGIIK